MSRESRSMRITWQVSTILSVYKDRLVHDIFRAKIFISTSISIYPQISCQTTFLLHFFFPCLLPMYVVEIASTSQPGLETGTGAVFESLKSYTEYASEKGGSPVVCRSYKPGRIASSHSWSNGICLVTYYRSVYWMRVS